MTTTIIIGKRIAITGLAEDEASAWAALARQANPVKAKLARLKKYHDHLDEFIYLGYVRPTTTGPMVLLPRGMLQKVWDTYGDDATWDVRVSTGAEVNVVVGGTPVDLRDYQTKALLPWMPGTWALPGLPVDGIIHAPTGSGKTYMGIALFQALQVRTLVMLHTKDLQKQWADNFREFGVEPRLVGGIGKAARIVGDEPVTIGMVGTLRNRPEELDANAGKFGLVIVDEAHHGIAKTYVDVVERLRPGARVGLTATPDREDGLRASLEMMMGPVRSVVSKSALEKAGVHVPFTVEMHKTGWAPTEDPAAGFVAATSEMIVDEDRNRMITVQAVAAMTKGHSVLVLTSRVDHAKDLASILGCPALVASVKDKDRARILDELRSGAISCVTATQLADEGLDVPVLSCVVMGTPARAKGRTMQRVGRALRPMEGKPAPVVIDFVDDHGLYVSQWRSRLTAYKQAGMTSWK